MTIVLDVTLDSANRQRPQRCVVFSSLFPPQCTLPRSSLFVSGRASHAAWEAAVGYALAERRAHGPHSSLEIPPPRNVYLVVL